MIIMVHDVLVFIGLALVPVIGPDRAASFVVRHWFSMWACSY